MHYMLFLLGATLVSGMALVFSVKVLNINQDLYSMIYQVADTQTFLATGCLFLKGDSQNKSYVLVCTCTFNEDLYSSVPNLLAPSGAHQKDLF